MDTATVTIDIQPAPVATSTLYLGTSGSGPSTYGLQTTPPPPGNPEPDHDGDGDDGLTIRNSSGALDDTDPSRYQHWTYTFAVDTTYDGQVRLGLWSTVENFDDEGNGQVVARPLSAFRLWHACRLGRASGCHLARSEVIDGTQHPLG